MNIELYRQLIKINEVCDNIEPYYVQERYPFKGGKNILCIDYREKTNNTWIAELKQKIPNNTFHIIHAKSGTISNGLILNIIKNTTATHYFDIICVNFNSIIYFEHLVQDKKEPFRFFYKKCKAFSTEVSILCFYYCIFAFIKIVTYIEMFSFKRNTQFFWHCPELKLLNFILFRYLNKCFFVGKSITKKYPNDIYEKKLVDLFYKKIMQLDK
jgi:hypothetical protein